jgi:hypothetical protein
MKWHRNMGKPWLKSVLEENKKHKKYWDKFMNRESDTNMTESDTMIMEMDTKTIKVRDLQNQVDELTKKRVQDTTVGHLLNVFGIFPRDTRNEPTISETKKQDVWTYDGPEDQFKRNGNWAFRGEILAALNGAPAADGMIINPDRYWYEHYQKAQEEIGEFKRQLEESITDATIAKSVMNEAVNRGLVEIRTLPQKDVTGNTVGKYQVEVWHPEATLIDKLDARTQSVMGCLDDLIKAQAEIIRSLEEARKLTNI